MFLLICVLMICLVIAFWVTAAAAVFGDRAPWVGDRTDLTETDPLCSCGFHDSLDVKAERSCAVCD